MSKPLKNNFLFLLTISVLVIIGFNVLLVQVESSSPDTSIKNVGDSLWFMVITLTTVGYGDMYPVTATGKIVGSIFVFGSLGVLGLLISRISNNYQKIMEDKKMGYKGTRFEGHVLIIGWNDFSKMVAEEIYHSSQKMAIVTNSKDDIDIIYSYFDRSKAFVLYSDFTNYDMLELTNASRASSVFISFNDDSETLLYVIDFKKRYADIPIVTTIDKTRLLETFKAAGVSHAVAKNEIVSRLVASYMFEPDVADLNNDIISSARDESDHDIQEYRVLKQNPFCGADYLDAFLQMKKDYDAVLLGVSKTIDGKRVLLKNPSSGIMIEENDYIILMSIGKKKEQLTRDFGVGEGLQNMFK